MDNPPRTKVVAVIGSTGVGKTKLSVELARRFNGEVVNADVMQMHRGLDVATAKVSEEERGGVPHHLLSFLDPLAEFTPLQCVAEARVSACVVYSVCVCVCVAYGASRYEDTARELTLVPIMILAY